MGPIELVDADGHHVEIGSRRQRQLLAILALRRGHVVDVDTISEIMWGDDQPVDPSGTVQTNVSRLRRLLEAPLSVETVSAGYVLTCPDDHLDVAQFGKLVAQVRAAPATAVPDLADEAVALWRGRPLGDLDHPDIESERRRLTELHIEMTEVRAEALCELDRHAEAVAVATQLVRDHPYRERPVATLMRALYAAGRQAEALAAFSDLRNRLLEDLGVDPSSDLQGLEISILQQRLAPNEAPRSDPSAVEQRIRICSTPDGTRLAYAVSGTGPPLVKAANWMTHLDFDWESPVWRHWNVDLSRRHTLVRYDERGCGLSDHDVERFTFDAWVDDLESVADALGLDHFPLLGISQGGAVAIDYAVRHPDRVSHLILWGAYPRGRLVRATSDEERREADLHLELARVGWGTDDPTFRQVFTSQFMPDGTKEQWAAFNELQARTCSADNAVRFMDVFALIDVTELAPKVTCPTLIMHSRDEIRVPMSNARELAALIPDSQLVLLESRNHILTATEPAWPRFLAELDTFLTAT